MTVSLASTYWLSPSPADGGEGFGDLDGLALSGLMVRYNIGVQHQQTYVIKRLDEDFFDEN